MKAFVNAIAGRLDWGQCAEIQRLFAHIQREINYLLFISCKFAYFL